MTYRFNHDIITLVTSITVLAHSLGICCFSSEKWKDVELTMMFQFECQRVGRINIILQGLKSK